MNNNLPPPRSGKGYAAHEPSRIPITRQYLVLYNAISLLLWFSLLARVLLVVAYYTLATGSFGQGLKHIHPSSGEFAKWVQTLAVAEILHSLVGLVRAPVVTTAMQVASRLLLVWGVVWLFAGDGLLLGGERGHEMNSERNRFAYLSMFIAWSVTECVRYGYFVFFLIGGASNVPKFLSWARYNGFFVLYPVGITSECWLVFNALPFAKNWDVRYWYFLIAALVIYVPGSYVLYTHMMSQRRKVMKGKGKERTI